MEFAVNYLLPEATLFLKLSNTYIKYPGLKWDLETLKELIASRSKIILHGLIPSSGSIIDPHLCDHIEEFSKFVKITNQKWLSFHFDYKPKYMCTDFDETIKRNICKIREYCGENIQILIENVPPVNNVQDWCMEPVIISNYCEKYDFGFVLDIPHAFITSKSRGETFDEYVKKLPLGRVKEIHVSGWTELSDGRLHDSHTICKHNVYKLLESVLYLTPNCEMISIEYSPQTEFTTLSNMEKIEEYKYICIKQQLQLSRVKSIVKKMNDRLLNI